MFVRNMVALRGQTEQTPRCRAALWWGRGLNEDFQFANLQDNH